MLPVLHCTPDALRALVNSKPGKEILFFTGPNLDVAAKNDPKARALRDAAEELLKNGRIVLLTKPADGHPHRCRYVAISKSTPRT